ncbi:hypothetical protein D3C73_606050 [compost metagenome]
MQHGDIVDRDNTRGENDWCNLSARHFFATRLLAFRGFCPTDTAPHLANRCTYRSDVLGYLSLSRCRTTDLDGPGPERRLLDPGRPAPLLSLRRWIEAVCECAAAASGSMVHIAGGGAASRTGTCQAFQPQRGSSFRAACSLPRLCHFPVECGRLSSASDAGRVRHLQPPRRHLSLCADQRPCFPERRPSHGGIDRRSHAGLVSDQGDGFSGWRAFLPPGAFGRPHLAALLHSGRPALSDPAWHRRTHERFRIWLYTRYHRACRDE